MIVMLNYYAHLNGINNDNQLLRSHNRNTAQISGITLKHALLYHTAFLSGLLHDLGKYTERFQQYLSNKGLFRRGEIIHSFQGCKFLLDLYHNESSSDAAYLTAELIAVAVGSHHGQFDCVNENHVAGLRYRSEKEGMDYAEAVNAFLSDCASREEIDCLFQLAAEEIQHWIDMMDNMETGGSEEFHFSVGLLERLISSAIIEGDRADTALFMNGTAVPVFPDDMRAVWQDRLQYFEQKLDALPNDTPINRARRQISDQCKQSAEKPCGIYRLYIPTGGGKTLSVLRYSLAHALRYNKSRLIFTSPLLSILEQNAAQIRKYLGNNDLILEHHSNVIQTDQTQDELDKRELWIQSWEAPVIITTLVQLLNTMFDGKTTSIRRFHALCNSVIVIDEVQTVPAKLLSLFNRAIFFLCTYCNTTVVLSSATQPCLEEVDHPVQITGGEIVPYDPVLWKVFERTTIEPLSSMREDELYGQIREIMHQTNSFLIVCNKKKEAARFVSNLKSNEWITFHLSAGMCMQHRRDVLARMTEILKANSNQDRKTSKQRILCVSTQVIEAGVDVSFETAMRLAAGMDSVIQTAGRCNRNGESELPRPVYLVNCIDEKLGKLREIQNGKDATIELLAAYEADADRFMYSLSSDQAIRHYYHCLYRNMSQEAQDYVLYSSDGRANGSLFDYLSINKKFTVGASEEINAYLLQQAFKTAGKAFSVFEDEAIDILVPYGEGAALIAELQSERAKSDLSYREMLLKKANNYTVSVYAYQKDQLERKGVLNSICDGCILYVQKEYYDDTIGVLDEPGSLPFWEV